MLHYDRIDVSEETDVDKTDESHKCINCNYSYLRWLSWFNAKDCEF